MGETQRERQSSNGVEGHEDRLGEREECGHASKRGITDTMMNSGRDPNGGQMS